MTDWTTRLPADLPAGHLVVPDQGFAPKHDGSPVIWMSDQAIADPLALWDRFYHDREKLGLYPPSSL